MKGSTTKILVLATVAAIAVHFAMKQVEKRI